MKYLSWPLLVFVLIATTPLSARHLVLGLGVPTEHILWSRFQTYVDLLAKQVDKDLRIELRSTPFLRIQEQVSKGELDGDLGRLKEAYEPGEAVVRVEEAASLLHLFVIFNRDQVLPDLNAMQQHKILASKDIIFHRRACQELKLNCEYVGPGSSSMDMLRLRRVSGVLATQFQVSELFRLSGNPALFRMSGKPYYSEPVYLFLAKKNADLAPGLSSGLKRLKQDGTYLKVFGMDPWKGS